MLCPFCGGPPVIIGILGNLLHLQCRNCGFPFAINAESATDHYPNGECPDCFEDIPVDAKIGESCENCGHVWNPMIGVDDEN